MSIAMDGLTRFNLVPIHVAPQARGQGHARSIWITFDLRFATGGKRASFFTYRYGDDRADYWVWALKPAGDLNSDGRLDLLFYSGDDTTDETVLLLQGATRFTASSSGLILCDMCVMDRDYNVVALGQYDVKSGLQIPNRIVARWNPHRGYFEGSGLYWIRTGRVALRETPSSTARVIEWFSKDDAVASTLENGQPVVKGRWLKVETEMGNGWMERARLVATSRWVRP
jgi:hypothetical protein